MLFLNGDEINELISMKDVIDAIESHYLDDSDKNEFVPERLFINDNGNTALLMPSFYEDYYGAKAIGIAPENIKINEPTLRGIYYLNKRSTMEPLGVFDARTITAMRTGAVSGLSIKYLAKKSANKVGIIGTGDQGWSHLQAACAVRPIEEVFVYNRSRERLNTFIERIKKQFSHVKVHATSIEELVEEADILCMTTTSKDPVIPDHIDMTGKHIAASGAFKSFMQEIPDAVIKRADRIFVDSHAAFEESLDMIKAKQFGKDETKVPEIKELVRLGENGYKENQLTIFKSVGMSIFDIITAKLIYERKQ
ncbi:ornithine cyclodeaminase family protein [bacterium LRH843]|nr:ornithine cyclodeaminase family protein [bacterium LRH843]